jgi:transcriptional regulator with XRE-family HTH domain
MYLRELIERSGLSQRECARRIGVGERTMREHLAIQGKIAPAPYAIQFCLECLAGDEKSEI